jgi:hypothetical protein
MDSYGFGLGRLAVIILAGAAMIGSLLFVAHMAAEVFRPG